MIAFAIIASYAVASYGLAWWMLAPINRVGGRLRLPTQFQLADILVLVGLLQLPLALVRWLLAPFNFGRADASSAYWLILFVLCSLVFVLWAAAVNVASKAGITGLPQRLTVILVLIPASLATMVALPLASLAVSDLTLESHWPDLLLGLAALLAWSSAVRWLSFWVLRGSRAHSSELARPGPD